MRAFGFEGEMDLSFRQVGAGAVERTLQTKLADIVHAADFGVVPGGNEADNKIALQAAINAAARIILPESDLAVTFNGTISLKPYTQLIGAGIEKTKLACLTSLAFEFNAGNGSEVEGPRLQDFSLHCPNGSGIKLNNSFSNPSDGQKIIMRPRFDRLKLFGLSTSPGPIGIEWNKVFDGVIDQCEIREFVTGYKSTGSDLCEIRGRTRIRNCATLIDAARVDTYGSGLKLDGCDLLGPTVRYIRSSDHHLMVLNCYFESAAGALTGSVFDLDFDYAILIQNNRLEVPASHAPKLLTLTGDGVLFSFENNLTAGDAWGTVQWNGGSGAKYFKNTAQRQHIVSRNNAVHAAFPFNSCDEGAQRMERYRTPWIISPATVGLQLYNYGQNVVVKNGAFVLPAVTYPGSLVRTFDPDWPLTGTVTIRVRAKASVNGQVVTMTRFNGDSAVFAVEKTLTDAYAWYDFFTSVSVTDLKLDFYNNDTTHGGEVHIERIVVERG